MRVHEVLILKIVNVDPFLELFMLIKEGDKAGEDQVHVSLDILVVAD